MTKNQKIHLTLTGYTAGQTLCGDPRNESDRYVHFIYAPEPMFSDPDLCPKCKHVALTPELDDMEKQEK